MNPNITSSIVTNIFMQKLHQRVISPLFCYSSHWKWFWIKAVDLSLLNTNFSYKPFLINRWNPNWISYYSVSFNWPNHVAPSMRKHASSSWTSFTQQTDRPSAASPCNVCYCFVQLSLHLHITYKYASIVFFCSRKIILKSFSCHQCRTECRWQNIHLSSRFYCTILQWKINC
jgi:hypothetical protein